MAKQFRTQLAILIGAVGATAAIMTMAMTPALGLPAASSPIVSRTVAGPVLLSNSDQTLVSIKLSAGKWDITGKMWADSQSNQSTTTTGVGCSIWNGSKFLDNSAFNLPKIGGANGTSGGVNVVNAADSCI